MSKPRSTAIVSDVLSRSDCIPTAYTTTHAALLDRKVYIPHHDLFTRPKSKPLLHILQGKQC